MSVSHRDEEEAAIGNYNKVLQLLPWRQQRQITQGHANVKRRGERGVNASSLPAGDRLN